MRWKWDIVSPYMEVDEPLYDRIEERLIIEDPDPQPVHIDVPLENIEATGHREKRGKLKFH